MTSNPLDHRLEAERLLEFVKEVSQDEAAQAQLTVDTAVLVAIAHAILAVR